jgi:hypothetical protein
MKPVVIAFAGCILAACAHDPEQPSEDPLRNTKKLAAEGHATLYRNGAFQVPETTIHLIPPGPSALELAAELAGMRALQSFQESIKHARESVDLAKAGVQRSMDAAGAVNRGAEAVASDARDITRFGTDAVRGAPALGSTIIAVSVSRAGPAYTATAGAGERVTESTLAAGRGVSAATDRTASTLMSGTKAGAGAVSGRSLEQSRRHASFAAEKFVKGYAAAPGKIGARAGAVAEAGSLSRFADALERSGESRGRMSGVFTDVIVDSARNYGRDVGRSFSAASSEIGQGARESGPTLAALKSLRWVLQGIFWDATIKPVTKMTAGTLGYVIVNTVAYPALITMNEGAVVANLAVQVTWNAAGSAYDITAPTATAAVAGLFSAVVLIGGQAAAGAGLAAGSAASAGTYVAGRAASAATVGGGYAAGKTVQYVAAPLSAAGIAGGGSVVGVVATAGAGLAGAGVAATGIAAEGTARVAGATGAAAVGVGGSVVSVAAGTALGTYELAKAVVVPAGHEVGAGIVLSYGTLSQLGAQSILAVSDASYMVLSLEGPRWVLYAVKGNVDKGENIPTGTVLDLSAMRQAGETFYAVPATEEEVKRVVDSVYGQLPEAKAPAPEAPAGGDR